MGDQEAADKQAWSLLPTKASISHAATQDSPIHVYVFVRSSEWAVNAHASD